MALQINIINNGKRQSLDLEDGAVLSWEWLNPLFALDLSQDSYSLPIDIPITPGNQAILGSPEVLELKQQGDDEVYWQVEVVEYGVPVLGMAKMSLMEVSSGFDYKSGSYTCAVSGAASLFGSKVRYKSLNALPLYPKITFTQASRAFAYDVMMGSNNAHRAALAFAPVHRPGYFDEGREDFDSESMYGNIANRVHKMLSTGVWFFAPPTATPAVDNPAAQGTVEYSQHRTIPFFRLSFVLKSLFKHFGYQLLGDVLAIPGFNDIFIDNNFSIEVYKFKNEDLNRSIDIRNHLPQVSVAEFLTAVCKAFNAKLDFSKTSAIVRLDLKTVPDITSAIDLTPYVLNEFESEAFEELYGTTNFTFDSGDQMVANLVKESIDERARFETLAMANAYAFSPALADGDIVYINSENLYYVWSAQYGKFLFYAEGQQAKTFKSEDKNEVPLAPLMRWLEVSDTGVNLNLNMCSATGAGSYVGFKAARVQNDFALRLLMIQRKAEPGITKPVPYSTNITDKLCLSYSMKQKGLYDVCFKRFNAAFANAKLIRTSTASDRLDLSKLEGLPVKILSNFYLVKKITNDIGQRGVADLELVKI